VSLSGFDRRQFAGSSKSIRTSGKKQREEMTEQTDVVGGQIRTFVEERLAQGKGLTVKSDSESLTESGIMDSLGIFRLVSFLEETFHLSVADEDITHENFRSIEAIRDYVVSHTTK
jgi:acyl carrier protein